MSPLTIVHSLAPASTGGLESVVRLLANGHRARGHRVILALSVESEEHPFVRTMRSDGIEVMPFTVRGRDVRRERHIIEQLITSTGANVVHTHGYRPDIIDIPVAQQCGVASVTTLHGFTGGGWKLRLYERLQLRTIRRASAVVAVSRGVEMRARRAGVSVDRIHLIRNAYTASAPLPTQTRARAQLGLANPSDDARPRTHIAWIGRMSQEKGADLLIEALALVRDLPILVSMIGDGPDRATLEARAHTLGVTALVRWHGLVPDAAQWLPAFDGFVLSSRTEGTPMVVLEAMAARVPIIATRVGGIPDMLDDTDAWLVAPESPAALASAIRDLVAQPNDANTKAARAHHRLAADFDVSAWLDQYEQLYTRVLTRVLT